MKGNTIKKHIITALLITTTSAPALAAYPASQPAQAAEVMVRMCQQRKRRLSTVWSRIQDPVT